MQTEDLAKVCLGQLKAGADFAELASSISDCQATRGKGGEVLSMLHGGDRTAFGTGPRWLCLNVVLACEVHQYDVGLERDKQNACLKLSTNENQRVKMVVYRALQRIEALAHSASDGISVFTLFESVFISILFASARIHMLPRIFVRNERLSGV